MSSAHSCQINDVKLIKYVRNWGRKEVIQIA